VNLARSVGAVARASGDGQVDWAAVAESAKAATDPGDLSLTDAQQAAYADDVRAARDRVRSVTGLSFDLPETVEVLDRHHWVDRNVETFARLLAPVEQADVSLFPDAARVLNTGSASFSLALLARNVLGQYDPLLLAEDSGEALYVVHPNVVSTAAELGVDPARFQRWIAFHEVTHAAEFGAAPWLTGYLEERIEESIERIAAGELRRDALAEVNVAMTAVEGYAELVMDRAFDEEYADLRAAVEERRSGGGPLRWLMRQVLGLGMKRDQYERGQAFFEAVADARGDAAAAGVWDRPENLPTADELDDPSAWLRRVDP
jgi:uncharacterized protein (DUF2342 family)